MAAFAKVELWIRSRPERRLSALPERWRCAPRYRATSFSTSPSRSIASISALGLAPPIGTALESDDLAAAVFEAGHPQRLGFLA